VFGNRVEEDVTQGGTTTVTRFAQQMVGLPAGWQGLAKNWADLNSTNQVQTRREYLDTVDAVFARIGADGTEAWYLADHLGSVRGLMNNSGSLIDALTYDAYGNISSESSPASGDRLKFAGGEYQANLGWYRFGTRWLDPGPARWTSPDPLGLAPDSNPYRYAFNAPSNLADPTGLEPPSAEDGQALARLLSARRDTGLSSTLAEGSLGLGELLSAMRAVGIKYNPVPTKAPKADYFKSFSNFCAGIGDVVSMGGTKWLRRGLGYDDVVDYNSGWYTAGQIAGIPIVVGTGFVNACNLGTRLFVGLKVVNGTQLLGGTVNGLENWSEGKYGAAALDFLGVAGSFAQFTKACFVAGTPLLTPTGAKAIEQFQVGDLVLSAPEDDPEGPVEARRVEEVFVRLGRVLKLRVGGQQIATTAEHPFYVRGKGWTPAGALQQGDLLRSHDKQWVAVQGLDEQREVTTVYNLRVAEYHTYFVGSREWQFSVWAHNAYKVQVGNPPDPGRYTGRTKGTLSWKPDNLSRYVPLTSGERNAAAAGLNKALPGTSAANYHHVESQAIQVINEQGIINAKLVINHPEGICGFCSPAGNSHLLEEGLRSGSTLEIFDRAGNSLLLLVGRFMG
jgi:RHS repeat-associated protein